MNREKLDSFLNRKIAVSIGLNCRNLKICADSQHIWSRSFQLHLKICSRAVQKFVQTRYKKCCVQIDLLFYFFTQSPDLNLIHFSFFSFHVAIPIPHPTTSPSLSLHQALVVARGMIKRKQRSRLATNFCWKQSIGEIL